MAQLKYCDKHNQVGFLRKPDESAGFAEIVDFLRGSNLRYALTTNPTIYDSLVKQFWQSAIANTRADGSLEINATIDTIRYTISEASIRDSLQLDDATGITMLPNADLFEGMGQIGYPTDGTFTFWKSFFTPQWRFLVHHLLHCISSKSGGWDQFGSNIATALICLSTGRVYNFSKLIFDGMVANLKSKKKFLMYPRFLQMILNIQTENKHLYLAVSLTKKIFGNMKRGFQGAPRPLLPSMLLAAANPIAGQEHAAVAQSQPSSSSPQDFLPHKSRLKLTRDNAHREVRQEGERTLKRFMKRKVFGFKTLKRRTWRFRGGKSQDDPIDSSSTGLVNTASADKSYTSSQDKGQAKEIIMSVKKLKKSKRNKFTRGSSLLKQSVGYFAKKKRKMVDLVNQRKEKESRGHLEVISAEQKLSFAESRKNLKACETG
ncbi:hypothetical protein Tco_0309220 [Tanacetum coccineum]